MVIQIRGTDDSGKSAIIQSLVEKRNGREIRLGKRIIGWNLGETIIVRSDGATHGELRRLVRHFAPQRNVVFEAMIPPRDTGSYLSLAKEMRDYMFAFVNTPLQICLRNARIDAQGHELREDNLREQWLAQHKQKEQLKTAGCEVATLQHDRALQQIEVLLMSARPVPGSYEAITMPKAAPRRRAGEVTDDSQAA